MFTTCKGILPDAQNIVRRIFKLLLKRADLPDTCWQDLRYTSATRIRITLMILNLIVCRAKPRLKMMW